MSLISTTTPIIVETSRGPSVAGTRITVYAVVDYLKSGFSPDAIRENLRLSHEQLSAVTEYIELHCAEVERDYAEIVCRSNERREAYEQAYRARARFAPELPLAEKAERMRRALAARGEGEPQHDDDQNPARPQS